MALGPDGSFVPGGPLKQGDRGGLNAGFSVNKAGRIGILQFGTELSWMAGQPDEMTIFVQNVRQRCLAAFGSLPYDKSTLPIRVVANQERRVIELYLPRSAEVLAANPEMWLALCEVIETKIAELRRLQ